MKQKRFITLTLLAMLLSSAVSTINASCKNDEVIIPLQNGLPGQFENDGRPRNSSHALIEAYWDTDMCTVNAYLRNAGQDVTVSIVDVATGETTQCVIPGDGPSYIPVTGPSGLRTIFFTLETGEVYYGSFLI